MEQDNNFMMRQNPMEIRVPSVQDCKRFYAGRFSFLLGVLCSKRI